MAVITLDIKDRFYLPIKFKNELRQHKEQFGFGLLGAAVYYRTYSRTKSDGTQERWADTVFRSVEGVMTIRKWWYLNNNLKWDNDFWTTKAMEMASAVFRMEMLPPGRSLWASGTEWMYERGSAALYNCAYTENKVLSEDASWAMDMLMCGVGVGHHTQFFGDKEFNHPQGAEQTFVIPDSREGWVESVRLLIKSYEDGSHPIVFDYSKIRKVGEPIRGFGGTASGPKPLKELHNNLRAVLSAYVDKTISGVRLQVDIHNMIGACVVAGNVRRSAEISLGDPTNTDFINLKNYGHYTDFEGNKLDPVGLAALQKQESETGESLTRYVAGPAADRAAHGWMSNNSVVLDDYEDFKTLPDLAERIRDNGEPGIFNLKNIQKYARSGEKKADKATGANPCAEIPLEDTEVCNLVEVFPSRCVGPDGKFSKKVFFNALELATLYASTVSLLPTHSDRTNAVIERNRRIGVSLSGIAKWTADEGWTDCITLMNTGYKLVHDTNKRLNKEAGVAQSVRVTTVKPSGTISLLAGVPSGMHLPPFSRYIRRVRVGENTPIVPLLQAAGVPNEPDVASKGTLVFEFPVDLGKVRGQKDVSVWAKAQTVVLLQKFWADNMVSNTINFDPQKEGHMIEDVLTHTIPFIKTMSFMPTHDFGSMYAQIPEEQVTLEEVNRRKKEITEINWDAFGGSDGEDSKFCNNDTCTI